MENNKTPDAQTNINNTPKTPQAPQTPEAQYEINIAELMGRVYMKIATWNNDHKGTDEQKGDALKLVSHDIIITVINEIANAAGASTKEVVLSGEKEKGNGFMSNFLRK